MLESVRRCPTAPALIGLSYDAGNASRRRSYTPILISVGNTDYNGMDACICIGYMPELIVAGASSDKNVVYEAQHELRQSCIGAIIDVIEACGEGGFRCQLYGSNGHATERLLFPVLAKMEFDTKERFKFFCCARQRACAIGSGVRKGHSALRVCTHHSSRVDLAEKIQQANSGDETAAASLSRRGIHPYRRVTSLDGRKHCVIPWPGRLYFGLFSFDIIHCLFINCIGYLLDALLESMTPRQKAELDRRVRLFTPFRNIVNGETTSRVTRLSSTAYLTAENKVPSTG